MYLTLATPGGGSISRKKLYSIFVVMFAVLLQSAFQPVSADSDKVESITVKVISSDVAPPLRVVKRIEASISTVSEHVLIGKKVGDIAANKASYERIVQDVFDRVLVGYSVQQVAIEPGTSVQIRVSVVPWGDVVKDISLQVDLSAISPELHELVKKDLGNIEESVRSVLIGLPTDAVEWAGGVSRTVVRELVAARLPEFKADLDVVAGPRTQVKLILMPLGPTIKGVDVVMRSSTIPNILLWEARPQMEDAAKILRGLPVSFVQRHEAFFRSRFADKLAAHPATRRYGLSVSPAIKAGEDTTINITADTSKYKITLEGYLDMDREKDNLAVKLHAGKHISKYDELFTEITLVPNSMAWRLAPGWGRRIGASTEAGIKYDITQNHEIIWINQQVNPKWSLRMERTLDTQNNEVGVRYRLHDFMSVEYIYDNNDKWIRLVGNL